MEEIAFICPYFGKLPYNQTKLFIKTCSYNKNYKWFIITNDETKFNLPNNVQIIIKSFDEVKSIFQSKFDFKISLETPYKICDFKPTYGYVFQDLIKNYKYWGYCDISDLLFGNLNKFISYDKIKNYDKVNFLGHLTLYKNTNANNRRFMTETQSGRKLENILGVKGSMAFDELNEYSINTIWKEQKFNEMKIDELYDDINPLKYKFQLSKYDDNLINYIIKNANIIFLWKKGNLYEYSLKNRKITIKEIGYVHYQKRKMNFINIDDSIQEFLITPKGFVKNDGEINAKKIKKYSKNKFIYGPYFKLRFKNLKWKIKNIIGEKENIN